jgi:hypothetical protein
MHILLLIFYGRIDFSEKYHIEGEDWEVLYKEKYISSKTYGRFVTTTSIMSI